MFLHKLRLRYLIDFCGRRVPLCPGKAVATQIPGCYAIAGNVADNMAEGYKDSRSQLSSATQHVMHAKANWRQARPPKAADVKQEQPDPDLQNGAAFIAGTASSMLSPVICFAALITVTAFAPMITAACVVSAPCLVVLGLPVKKLLSGSRVCSFLQGCTAMTPSAVMLNVLFAGVGANLNSSLEDAVKPAAQRNKRSKTGN